MNGISTERAVKLLGAARDVLQAVHDERMLAGELRSVRPQLAEAMLSVFSQTDFEKVGQEVIAMATPKDNVITLDEPRIRAIARSLQNVVEAMRFVRGGLY